MNEQLTDLAMWTTIVAFFVPIIVSFIQQPRWQPWTRAVVGAVVSGAAGAGTVYFATPGLFDTGVTPTVVLTVIMASIASYRGFWKQVGLRRVESATSPGDDTLEREQAVAAEFEAHLLEQGVDGK